MSFKLAKTVLTLIIIFNCTAIFSQEDKEETGTANTEFIAKEERKDWSFKIAPYAWLAGTATDVGGEKIRQSFNDLASLTNFGLQVVAQARYKKWSLSSNLTYAELGSGEEIGPIKVDLNITQVIFDTTLGYILIDKIDFGDDVIRVLAMKATVGAVYCVNDINVDIEFPIDLPNPPNQLDEKVTYVDLVFGTNFRIILSKSVLLGLSANVGGFGIGNSSELYWDFLFVNTFKISKLMTVTAGYRTFTDKTVSGEGDDQIKTNIKTFGPLLGVAFNL